MIDLCDELAALLPASIEGRVVQALGATVAIADFPAPVGAVVEIQCQAGPPLEAEVIAFREALTLAAPLGPANGVARGDRVRLLRTRRTLGVGPALIGRVVDALGHAVDGRPTPRPVERVLLDAPAPLPLERAPIDTPLATGIRAIDGLLTCGQGQRLGIFAGSGVGKSTLLGMLARNSAADVNVIALVGERGREVQQFLESSLTESGLARSVVVVATSDQPALLRVRAAFTAMAIAEHFRDQGHSVLLLMDSITRLAMAQREIALAAGEPPAARGYPPSVFSLLPKLVERAGRTRRGSITAFYSVLVEGDDPHEPLTDALRGLLDGHLWLSRNLAARAHFPALDVLESISRLMPQVTNSRQQAAATEIRALLAALRDHEDLLSIGAYRPGSNPQVDAAIAARDAIERWLRQAVDERSTLQAARDSLLALCAEAGRPAQPNGAASP